MPDLALNKLASRVTLNSERPIRTNFIRPLSILLRFSKLSCVHRHIEGKVVEISRLQEIFAEKVLQQVSE